MNFHSFAFILFSFVLQIYCQNGRKNGNKYYGKYIGSFPGTAHNVNGDVYAVNSNTIYIREFTYDGTGPAAFFKTGNGSRPHSSSNWTIPDELGRIVKLNAYNKQNIILSLPKGKTLRDFQWISVWCEVFAVNFGHVTIQANFDYPKEKNLGPIPTLAHQTRADSVTIVDTKTLIIRNLHYDGTGPDAFFYVGTGNKPHETGVKIPDENGSLRKISGYQGVDIKLRLPDNYTVFDFDWFAIFCIRYRTNFGSVEIPKYLNVPPDLKTLSAEVSSFSNCETIFPDLLQVSWEVRHPDIYIQLEGRLEPNQYMSFGLSGSTRVSQMIGSDVTVAFYDANEKKAKVVDYTLTSKGQCSPQSRSGACPDHIVGGNQDSELISSNYVDGLLRVSYKRRLHTGDDYDQPIIVTTQMVVVAAVGPINSKGETAFHSVEFTRASSKPIKIHFGRVQNERNCNMLASASSQTSASSSARLSLEPWKPSVIHAQNDDRFHVVIGPSGGKRGYIPITGIVSWGVAYWINDMLIPEIHVKRGQKYTFVVETGNDPVKDAQYHPLYITNHREGGGGQRPQELGTPSHKVYAGANYINGSNSWDPSPGAGRYCELKIQGVNMENITDSIEEYRRTLRLECENRNTAASFVFSPDENTPDVVYYQCFQHLNLGWKILVSASNRLSGHLFYSIVLMFVIKLLHQ